MRLAIDPGKDTGWARLDSQGFLVECGLGCPRAQRFHPITAVVLELPQIYRGRFSKGDPNDLIPLAVQVGRLSEVFAEREVHHVLPRTWKGTVDPDILCRRVVMSLFPDEKALLYKILCPLARKPMTDEFVTCGTRHNVIDAVGLAIWSLRRARAGTFTR